MTIHNESKLFTRIIQVSHVDLFGANPFLVMILTNGLKLVYALLDGSFLVDAPLPKSPCSRIKMVVHFDIIDLVGNYMAVHELKSPYEEYSF